jgi:NADH-quinone oxidoreductase subunit L
MIMPAILTLSTILIPWLGAVVVWALGEKRQHLAGPAAVVFSGLAGLAALLLYPAASAESVIDLPMGDAFGNLTLRPDGLACLLVAIATVIGCLAVIFSLDYMRGEHQLTRYYAFILLFIGAMTGLVLSGSLLYLFFFWEITALSSYALISFNNDDPKAVRGGIKALIMTQVGGAGLLAGALALYAATGSFQIDLVLAAPAAIPGGVLAFAAFGFLVAAAAKSAQFPFQTWLPDAMEAPTPISALIHAATMVNAGVYLLARFYPAFADVPGWKTAVIVVGVVTAISAALMAIVAGDLKRVLAYSTVSQLGYMVYAIGLGAQTAVQFHLLSHAIFKALLFLSAGAVIHSVGTRDLERMGGLGKKMPFIRAAFVVGALALAGIPILNGFWSKELILEAGLEYGPAWGYWLMLIGAGLTALYSLRVTWLVFYGMPRTELHIHPAGKAMKTSLLVLTVGSFTSWLLVAVVTKISHLTLPYHKVDEISIGTLVKEILANPGTITALLTILGGAAIWVIFMRFQNLPKFLRWTIRPIQSSFGMEAINTGITRVVGFTAEKLRKTQTGLLSWNLVYIVIALILTIVLLGVGA